MRGINHTHRWLLALIALTVYSGASYAINHTSKSIKGLAQAYGFVVQQDNSLTRIAKEFPDLAWGVESARSQFNSTFPHIKTKLEDQIKRALGERGLQELVSKLSQIKESHGRLKITREIASDLIEQVKARAKGQIESPVLEYLLAVKYESNPVGEYLDGFRQRFQTDGTGKSQGIKLALQAPRSWVVEDGERPHIVKKWVSENGTGTESIILDIRDGQGFNPTKKEMEEIVRSSDLKEIIPEGYSYVSSGYFTIEKRPGYWLQMTSLGERADVHYFQHVLKYQFFFRGKAIGLLCSAMGHASDRAVVDETFKRIRPLCQQVINSFVLLQAY